MLDDAMAARAMDEPSEAVVVRVGLAILDLHGRPHLVEARALQKFLGVKSSVPFGEIKDSEVERAHRR